MWSNPANIRYGGLLLKSRLDGWWHTGLWVYVRMRVHCVRRWILGVVMVVVVVVVVVIWYYSISISSSCSNSISISISIVVEAPIYEYIYLHVGGLREKNTPSLCVPDSAIFMAYLPFIIIGPVLLLLLPSTIYFPPHARSIDSTHSSPLSTLFSPNRLQCRAFYCSATMRNIPSAVSRLAILPARSYQYRQVYIYVYMYIFITRKQRQYILLIFHYLNLLQYNIYSCIVHNMVKIIIFVLFLK